jgi:alpha/beta superfamily hydrolase
MIQSTRDEYVPSADYRDLESVARAPHQQVLIDASNHRFTDKMQELKQAFDRALSWISAAPAK